jgi:hypothetical protein
MSGTDSPFRASLPSFKKKQSLQRASNRGVPASSNCRWNLPEIAKKVQGDGRFVVLHNAILTLLFLMLEVASCNQWSVAQRGGGRAGVTFFAGQGAKLLVASMAAGKERNALWSLRLHKTISSTISRWLHLHTQISPNVLGSQLDSAFPPSAMTHSAGSLALWCTAILRAKKRRPSQRCLVRSTGVQGHEISSQRAERLASAWNDGRVLLPKTDPHLAGASVAPPWVGEFVRELQAFTGLTRPRKKLPADQLTTPVLLSLTAWGRGRSTDP